MWLLDHNLPYQLVSVLKSAGIECKTAYDQGWNELQNGEFLSVASRAGFTCILTRDVLFAESAYKEMMRFSNMAIVLITISQCKGKKYAEEFLKHWQDSPISPDQGKMICWPL